MEKARVKVSIFDREYSIVSEVDPDYISKAAAYVDSKMREVSRNFPNISENRIAVLAALNITDELFKSDENISDDSDLEERISRIALRLSESL